SAACACRVIKSKITVMQRGGNEVMFHATEIFPEFLELRTRKSLSMKGEESIADFGAMFDGSKHMTINSRANNEPVQDGFDEGMFLLAYLEVASEIALQPIDTNAAIALQAHLLEYVLPALTENLEHRRAQFHFRSCGQLQHTLQHLPRRTRRHRFLTSRAMGPPERRVQH